MAQAHFFHASKMEWQSHPTIRGIHIKSLENKNTLEIPAVFAGLLTVIIIGLMVENFVFRVIERRTVRKWGMQA